MANKYLLTYFSSGHWVSNVNELPADLFLCSYQREFLDNIIRDGHRKLARSFNLCYRYIDNLIVLLYSTTRSLGIMSKRFTPHN